MNDTDRLGVLEARVKDLIISFSYLHEEVKALRNRLDLAEYKLSWVHEFGSEV
jgi:hypothetical protein